MSQVQYNFKVDEEIKVKAEELSKKYDSKQDFLAAMITSLQEQLENKHNTDLDLSKYTEIDKGAKEVIYQSFRYILNNVETSIMNIKKEAEDLELEKKELESIKSGLKEEKNKLLAECNEDRLQVLASHKIEIEKFHKEYEDKNLLYNELKNKLSVTLVELSNTRQEAKKLELIANNIQTTILANEKLQDNLTKTNQSIEELKNKNILIESNYKEAITKHQNDNNIIVEQLKNTLNLKIKNLEKSDWQKGETITSLEMKIVDLKKDLDLSKKEIIAINSEKVAALAELNIAKGKLEILEK